MRPLKKSILCGRFFRIGEGSRGENKKKKKGEGMISR